MAFALLAVLAAIVCIRLGFWQLDRHEQRREATDLRERRLAGPPVPLERLLEPGVGADAAAFDSFRWRRVRLTGRWIPGEEVLIRNRALDGRPGVHVVTPLRVPLDAERAVARAADRTGVDTTGVAVLVLRGWLAAPDAMNPGRIAPPGPAAPDVDPLVGIVRSSREGLGDPLLPAGEGTDERPSFAAVDAGRIEAAADGRIDYPPFFVQLLPEEARGGAARQPGEPVPVPLPEAGLGPHLGYAVQWFGFAAVALVGGAAFLYQQRREGRSVRRGRTRG